MANAKRGAALTVFAVLFVLHAINDFVKPFGHSRQFGQIKVVNGIVFFGDRLQGNAAYVGWLVGAFLLIYALAIWRMRGYVLALAYVYGVYVVLNVALFTIRYPTPDNPSGQIFAIVYAVGAILGAWIPVILLRRRSAQLA